MIQFENIQHEEPVAPTASFEAVLVDIPPEALDFPIPPCPPGGEGAPKETPAAESVVEPISNLESEIAIAAKLSELGWIVNQILQNEVFAHCNQTWRGRPDLGLLEICVEREENKWIMSLIANTKIILEQDFEWLPVAELPTPHWVVVLVDALRDGAE